MPNLTPDDIFVDLVRDMRMAQKRYFRARLVSDLEIAKAYERKVDGWLKMYGMPAEQPKLPGLQEP